MIYQQILYLLIHFIFRHALRQYFSENARTDPGARLLGRTLQAPPSPAVSTTI